MSSPWGKIEKVEAESFSDIMSEEYARGLQEKENKKYTEIVHAQIFETNNPGNTMCQDDDAAGEEKASAHDVVVPEEVMKVIQEDAAATGVVFSEVCDSDALIAQVLQNQFDHEYNEELKRYERAKNKNSKISISLKNFRRQGGNDETDEEAAENADEDDDLDNPKRHWDRFETNEKKFDAIPKCGYKINNEGEMITKHDSQICGVRNACKVMSFPPDFQSGDTAGFDMKLSNAVFNQLKTYSRKSKKTYKMHDRKENMATAEMGVDERTRLLLYKLINNQILERVNGIISTGKEAVILHADSDPSYVGDILMPKECAIKIFKTTLNEFKQRDRYIKDDYRFKDRFSKQNNRTIINMWAEKEMHNMMRMQKYGINCPDVVILKEHVLVMSFIGDNHNAAPKLKDACLSEAELSVAYEEILAMMHKLYQEAHLVHADLSEYNILWHDDKCWFIDVAQSVEPGHPSALEFLMRDCGNIVTFFKRRGLPKILSREELFKSITGLNPQSYNAAMLERIHMRGETMAEATAPNEIEIPEEFKPVPYPFDLAWERSQADKDVDGRQQAVGSCANETSEVTDSLRMINLQTSETAVKN